MTDIPTRCDIAAALLRRAAHGQMHLVASDTLCTRAQLEEQASRLLTDAGREIRALDYHTMEQANAIFVLEAALHEARTPFVWRMIADFRRFVRDFRADFGPEPLP